MIELSDDMTEDEIRAELARFDYERLKELGLWWCNPCSPPGADSPPDADH